MAEILIDNLRHSYMANPVSDDDFAIRISACHWG